MHIQYFLSRKLNLEMALRGELLIVSNIWSVSSFLKQPTLEITKRQSLKVILGMYFLEILLVHNILPFSLLPKYLLYHIIFPFLLENTLCILRRKRIYNRIYTFGHMFMIFTWIVI